MLGEVGHRVSGVWAWPKWISSTRWFPSSRTSRSRNAIVASLNRAPATLTPLEVGARIPLSGESDEPLGPLVPDAQLRADAGRAQRRVNAVAEGMVAVVVGVEDEADRLTRGLAHLLDDGAGRKRKPRVDDQHVILEDHPARVATEELRRPAHLHEVDAGASRVAFPADDSAPAKAVVVPAVTIANEIRRAKRVIRLSNKRAPIKKIVTAQL